MKEWKPPRGGNNSNNTRKRSHGQQISEDWIQLRISFAFIIIIIFFFSPSKETIRKVESRRKPFFKGALRLFDARR